MLHLAVTNEAATSKQLQRSPRSLLPVSSQCLFTSDALLPDVSLIKEGLLDVLPADGRQQPEMVLPATTRQLTVAVPKIDQ